MVVVAGAEGGSAVVLVLAAAAAAVLVAAQLWLRSSRSWAPYVGVAEVMLHRAAVAAAGFQSDLHPNISSSNNGLRPRGPSLMVAAEVAVSCTAAAAAEATAEPLAAAG